MAKRKKSLSKRIELVGATLDELSIELDDIRYEVAKLEDENKELKKNKKAVN